MTASVKDLTLCGTSVVSSDWIKKKADFWVDLVKTTAGVSKMFTLHRQLMWHFSHTLVRSSFTSIIPELLV